MENKIGQLEIIDIQSIVETCQDKWFNTTLSQVNDSVVRLGIIEGEFHWHQHQNEDEFFFVLDGKLFIDVENGTIELNSNQGYTVPKGKTHRTRAPQKTVILMVEQDTVVPIGD